ncbi:hypothetical protein QVH35_00780 [Candidatus Nitrosotenuis chungbukensis]|uniref:hypothetical protein n=1 Tax=Candidatus Nitrosotenuis chungbukensis TaxID=1353246 RepID=UPI0026740DCD|nr:hypothetical protein [Candidatus Nitrosotenuis chungbukensis]WKT58099.1 hypothetical protein QVH35_00780 [Candidatus Nitrosotenuis chungbukensis]
MMLVAAIVTIPHAVADKEEKSRDSERKLDKADREDKKESKHDEKPRPAKPIRQTVSTGVGVGAAVDIDGGLHRSHYRVDLAITSTNSTGNTNSTVTNSTDTYQVKKGQIFILEKGSRGTYKIIPETWRIDIGDNKSTFSATGQVKGGKATYDVSLTGEKIRDVKNGSLYRVDGKLQRKRPGIRHALHIDICQKEPLCGIHTKCVKLDVPPLLFCSREK